MWTSGLVDVDIKLEHQTIFPDSEQVDFWTYRKQFPMIRIDLDFTDKVVVVLVRCRLCENHEIVTTYWFADFDLP